MKTRITAFTLAACISLGAHTLLAQNYATVPVGFIKTTIPAATNATTPATAIVAAPFYSSPNGSSFYAGAIGTVDSSNQFSLTANAATQAGWISSQFSSGAPYLARIKTAANSGAPGLFFLITGNNTSQLTLATRGLDLTTLLSANDTFEIVRANTLGGTLGTQPPTPANPAGTSGVVSLMTDDLYPNTHTASMIQSSASSADNVLVYDGTGWTTYYFYSNPAAPNYNDGSGSNPGWKTAADTYNSPSRNNVIIYPDEAIFVRHRSTTRTVDLVFSGSVPSTQEQSDLRTPANTLLANRFPTDSTLIGLNLQNVSNWKSGSSAGSADNVLIYNSASSSWTTYYYYSNQAAPNYNDGSGSNPGWKTAADTYNSTTRNTTVIPAGSAVFVRRPFTAANGSTTSLVQSLPYTLN